MTMHGVLARLAGTRWDRGVGRLLRLPLRLLPEGAVLPVLSGELRGARWIVGSATHGSLLGTYEHEVQRRFAELVEPGDVVFDVGAAVGFYTLLASRLVGASGRVVAFEPLPRNLAFLTRHVELNGAENVGVRAEAVGAHDGTAAFRLAEAAQMGRLSEGGEVEVTVARLDTLVLGGELPEPDVVKIDVEGAESAVLEGACEVLERSAPELIVALHGSEQRRLCLDLLGGHGYRVAPLDGRPLERTEEIHARRAR